MAKLKGKDTTDLSSWDMKELRKLRMAINNRLDTLKLNPKAAELKEGHPLFGKGPQECQALLDQVRKAERTLSKSEA